MLIYASNLHFLSSKDYSEWKVNCIGKLQSGKQTEKSNSYETLQVHKFFYLT
jgi:hypothetical protein